MSDNESKGFFYFLKQSIPPLLLALPLVNNPSGIWFTLPLCMLCSLFSLFSIANKLRRLAYSKSFLIRPLLVIIISLINFIVAYTSYELAKGQLLEEANRIQLICTQNKICPDKLKGWEEAGFGYRREFGNQYKYMAFYKLLDENITFEIYMHQIPDRGILAKGGVQNKPIKLESIADEPGGESRF